MDDVYCSIERPGNPISLGEWTRVVEADDELEFSTADSLLCGDENGGEFEAYAVTRVGDPDCAFILAFGRISAEGSKEAVVRKARQIALKLTASVRVV